MKKKEDKRVGVIDKEIRLAERKAIENLEEANRSLAFVRKQMKNALRFLPDGWSIRVRYFGSVDIHIKSEGKEVTPVEFHYVASNIFRCFGIYSYKTRAEEYGAYKLRLKAEESAYKHKDYVTIYYVTIVIATYEPSCEVTWEEREEPARKVKVAVVPPECLGVRERTTIKQGYSP